jgi:hypothetical protein
MGRVSYSYPCPWGEFYTLTLQGRVPMSKTAVLNWVEPEVPLPFFTVPIEWYFGYFCNTLSHRVNARTPLIIDWKKKTVSPILEDFRSRSSVQIEWFKNRRNLLQGTKIVDQNQIFVGPELILYGLGTKY